MANHDTDAKPGAITPAEADAAMATAGEIPMSAGEVQAAVDYAVRGDGGEKLAATWMKRAAELREEAGRIHRTIKAPTDAEERCRVRADVWEEAAEAVAAALRGREKQACGGSSSSLLSPDLVPAGRSGGSTSGTERGKPGPCTTNSGDPPAPDAEDREAAHRCLAPVLRGGALEDQLHRELALARSRGARQEREKVWGVLKSYRYQDALVVDRIASELGISLTAKEGGA